MIENHVVNLDLSKRLKDLGFYKTSLFYWVVDEKKDHFLVYGKEPLDKYELALSIEHIIYKAYVATELLEWLPEKLYIDEETVLGVDKKEYTLIRERIKGVISPYLNIVYYRNWDYIILGKLRNQEENECNALAKMLIYLIEKGLIDVTVM